MDLKKFIGEIDTRIKNQKKNIEDHYVVTKEISFETTLNSSTLSVDEKNGIWDNKLVEQRGHRIKSQYIL